MRRLREARHDVDLDDADDEGQPREQQQAQERALREHEPERRRGDGQARPWGAALASYRR